MNKITNDLSAALKKLELKPTGYYKDNFYIIDLKDSNDYSKIYTLLDDKAVNTEYPNFGTNTNKSTVKITNYFEVTEGDTTFNIFLIADFINDKYYVKFSEV